MAKMVGLSRNIKMSWLDKAAEFYMERDEHANIKQELSDYLAFEITSATNLRKTNSSLLYIWCFEDEKRNFLRDKALVLFSKKKDSRLICHWCMLLAAYPVFMDVAQLIGKLFEFQDEFKLSTLREKIYEKWGERTTLLHSLDKLMATFVDLGVLERKGSGLYSLSHKQAVDKEARDLLLYTMLTLEKNGSVNMDKLNDNVLFFPFEYKISMEDLIYNEHVVVQRFGDMFMVELKKEG